MKHSINKIFNNLYISLILTTILIGIAIILILGQDNSYEKIKNIKNQKHIIKSLINLQQDDLELALIRFNGKSTQLHIEIDKLRNLNKYDYIGNFVLGSSNEYLADLDKLSELTTSFNKRAYYYIKNIQYEKEKSQELKNTFYSLNSFLDSLLIKNISYDEEKFKILKLVIFLAFINTFFLTLWYRKRLNAIHKDILYLYAVETSKDKYDIFSEEADAIKLRMGKKHVSSDDLTMTDPVTQINNYKGMLSTYSERKDIKDHIFTSVTTFEIDNFSKQNRAFSQEFTQAILKKIAFTISLYEQATDIIARTGYNQFTLVLSRTSREQSYKDADMIRQSISEIKFKEPSGSFVTITVSGGFIIKSNSQSLDESIKKAIEILDYAKQNGKNYILQSKDMLM